MALDDGAALDRATRAMREQPQPGWVELSGSIRDAVRATRRRGPDVPAHGGPDVAGSVSVADRVLRLLLRDGVNGPTRSLAGVKVHVEDGRLRRLHLDLACRYGTVVREEADLARGEARTVLLDTLGSGDGVAIDVRIVDVDRE